MLANVTYWLLVISSLWSEGDDRDVINKQYAIIIIILIIITFVRCTITALKFKHNL